MKKMSSEGKSNRGRKRTLTDSARKRNRTHVLANYQKTRINIGQFHDRWMELKGLLAAQTHAEVARVLLDCYDSNKSSPTKKCKESFDDVALQSTPGQKETARATTSTPAVVNSTCPVKMISDISGISSSDCDKHEESEMSGVEELPSGKTSKMEKSSSFVNPFDLTIEMSEEKNESDEDHSSDEDYEPTFNITLREDLNIQGDVEDDPEEDCEEDEPTDISEEPLLDLDPGISRIKHGADLTNFLTDTPFLVYSKQLLKLANCCITGQCQGCGEGLSVKMETVVSAVYLRWVCKNGHVAHTWCSQPVMNRRIHAGDMMLASALLLSGSNFWKIQLFAKFLKLPIMSRSTYFRIQRTYLIPSIDDFWIDHQQETIQQFREQDVIIMGAGRMDSPGHCAQYCSYTFMEYTSKKILCIITMDKRQTEKKSTNLEKACFLKGLKFLLDKGLRIVEVVTDANPQVGLLMKTDYPRIKHSFDIWHGSKNLGKKIIKVGTEKKNDAKQLLEWTKDIVNHYWYTAQITSTKEEFIGTWIGMLHHVTNNHEWVLQYSTTNKCSNGPLTEERNKGWLEKDSSAHRALRNIILNKRLVNNIPYYLNCRSTAEIENFQNLILMYSSKRNSYTPPAYRGRNRLAALDHNKHAEREVMTNKDGRIRCRRIFQKRSCRWSAFPVKCDKDYTYVCDIIKKILERCLNDEEGMHNMMILEGDDPRRLSAHLAPIPPPPTRQIVEEQKSRFSANGSSRIEDPDKTLDYTF